MTHACPHCGKPINPAKLLGSIRTPKREAAWKRNGERMRLLLANAKKLGDDFAKGVDTPIRSGASRPPTPFASGGLASGVTPAGARLAHDTGSNLDTRVMPKGSMSKEELKALLGGGAAPVAIQPPSMPDRFEVNIHGEPHVVGRSGKRWFAQHAESEGSGREISEEEARRHWEATL